MPDITPLQQPTPESKLLNEGWKQTDTVTQGQFTSVQLVTYGVLVVVAIGAVTMILQYFTASQVTFQDLKDQIIIQNSKIDFLSAELNARNLQK